MASLLDEFSDRLSGARSSRAVGRVLARALRRVVPSSACHLFHLQHGELSLEHGYGYSSEVPVDFAFRRMVEALPITERDTGSLEFYLSQPRRTFDLARVIPARQLERTEVYNEFWRPCRLERQMTHFIVLGKNPVGWIALARTRRERPFTATDLDAFEALGQRAGRALIALQESPSSARLLAALGEGLPSPCLLFDGRGRILWLNDAAALRLEVHSARWSTGRMVLRAGDRLEALRRHALAVVRTPRLATQPPPVGVGRLLSPGEDLFLRRLGGPAPYSTMVMMTFVSSVPAVACAPVRLRALGLSRREAEVTALAIEGYAALNIAARLNVARSTVLSHLKNVYRKLDVGSRAELAARVLRPDQPQEQ